jgi:transcriptional regulator with XRE-family HTH domain
MESAENWNRFGQWVASQRQSVNLTQEQLAERIGLDKQQVYRIEKGGSTKRATVVKIAQAFNASSEYAISLAFGVVDKKTALEVEDRQAEAARAAEMIKGFLNMPPDRQNQILGILKILQSDHPELLNSAPIEIISADDLTESDAEIDDPPPRIHPK